MLRKALILNTLFIILIFPTFSLGQIVGTSFSADRVIVRPDNTIFADGNVVIRQGAIFIRAESVTINQETSEIHFSEITEFSDDNAIKISAEEAVLDTKISSGIISAARIVIDETIKIQDKSGHTRKWESSHCEGYQ